MLGEGVRAGDDAGDAAGEADMDADADMDIGDMEAPLAERSQPSSLAFCR